MTVFSAPASQVFLFSSLSLSITVLSFILLYLWNIPGFMFAERFWNAVLMFHTFSRYFGRSIYIKPDLNMSSFVNITDKIYFHCTPFFLFSSVFLIVTGPLIRGEGGEPFWSPSWRLTIFMFKLMKQFRNKILTVVWKRISTKHVLLICTLSPVIQKRSLKIWKRTFCVFWAVWKWLK